MTIGKIILFDKFINSKNNLFHKKKELLDNLKKRCSIIHPYISTGRFFEFL